MENTEGYFLRQSPVACPQCNSIFATPCLVELPEVTEFDIIEADLHRVLPHPALRAALIAVCPDCEYADWSSRFGASIISPHLLPEAREIDYSKKFAMAVKSARQKGVGSLDIAFIALNGYWCAREAGERFDLWLELASFEQNKGLAEEILPPDAGLDHLVMAELWRQLRVFDRAVAEYDLCALDEFIPPELIRHQKMLCQTGDCLPTQLPPQIVRKVFPEAKEATRRLIERRELEKSQETQLIKSASSNMQPGVRFTASLRGDDAEAQRHPSFSNSPPDRRPALSTTPQQPALPDTSAGISAAVARAVKEAIGQTASPQAQAAPPPAPANALQAAAAETAPVSVPQPARPAVQAAPSPETQANKKETPKPVTAAAANPPVTISIAHAATGSVSLVQATVVKATAQDIAATPVANASGGSKNIPPAPAAGNVPEGAEKAPRKDKAPSRASQSRERATTQHHHYFMSASSPDAPAEAAPATAAGQSSNKRSQEPARDSNQQDALEIPELKLTNDKPRSGSQPATGTGTGTGSPDYSDAIAQVESFLNLTRQSTYRNWIRGYRTN